MPPGRGAEAYDAGEELHERALKFLAAVDWDSLIAQSSALHHDVSCNFQEKFSNGHLTWYGISFLRTAPVGSLGFKCLSWKMPELENVFDNREALDSSQVLGVEIAIMKFMKYICLYQVN